jgi:hypothetical protein
MELKKQLIAKDMDYLEDKECSLIRKRIMKAIKNTQIHPDEIQVFSEKFLQAKIKIRRYIKEQERLEKHLKVASFKELRTLGR